MAVEVEKGAGDEGEGSDCDFSRPCWNKDFFSFGRSVDLEFEPVMTL